jgi:hypothetical protein
MLRPVAPAHLSGLDTAPVIVDLPVPPLGAPCFLLERKGVFVLRVGPGVLRTIACTHAGAGTLEAIDGVPDERGFFPDEDMPEADPAYWSRRGRPLYRANPVVMGSWMLDGGFIHGLTIRAMSGHEQTNAIASIVYMPFRSKAPPAPKEDK